MQGLNPFQRPLGRVKRAEGAENNGKRNFNTAKLERIIKALHERITAYLTGMERQDAAEPSAAEPASEGLQAKLEQLRGRRQFHEEIRREVAEEWRDGGLAYRP